MKTSVVIVMGVSGCGKTTVGRLLAERLSGTFADADGFHPADNIAKMSRGEPLTDADRAGWLEALRARIETCLTMVGEAPLVVACSALKQRYRQQLLRPGEPGVFVFLQASMSAIEKRLQARSGHFFPPGLLASQFADLEVPTSDEPNVVTISTEESRPESVVARVLEQLD
ncbi:MAG: gluconokinase [Opitutales bacterium]